MRRGHFRVSADVIVAAVAFAVLVFMLWERLELGLIRYFDADEFSYLHWGHNVFAGNVPYRDFLLYVPPGFLWILALLFFFVQGAAVLAAGRIFAWFVFVGICIGLGMLFVLIRGNRGDKGNMGDWGMFLLPGVILSFLPMPADKFLEVRPDNLAILISLIGLIIQIRKKYFWAGLAYGVSLLILPKTLPQVAVAVLIGHSWPLMAGIGVPLVLFALWIVPVWGDALYSLTRLPFEVNRIGYVFSMQPDLFFYPNGTYYGLPGIHPALLINHGIWLTGLVWASMRLVTPFLPNGKRGVRAELLVSGSLFSHVVSFMYGYPMRHAQYLIPIAVFVAFYAADFVYALWEWVKKYPVMRQAAAAFCVLGLFATAAVSDTVFRHKNIHTNAEDAALVRHALDSIPDGSYVFDLIGATIYFRDPYYVCCVPFGQWAPYLTRPLPSLSGALERTGTKYIYEGRLGRVDSLPEIDRRYIRTQYAPDPRFSGVLIRK